MDSQQLDRLVAEIGEEILARVAVTGGHPPNAEGLNVADMVCPGCTRRCAQIPFRAETNVVSVKSHSVPGPAVAVESTEVAAAPARPGPLL